MSGYMTFVDTEVLTAEQVNGYLMAQVVARFTTAAERDATLLDPDENQLCYVVGAGLQIFDSGAWTAFAMVTTVAGRTGAVVLVKGDVGLGNVDNTSDATKNAAVATLTNKTLTAPVVNAPTGIVKADVGLGNVDNTSDVNKPVSTAQAAGDTAAKARANHTGTQLAATVSDFSAAADARITAQKGAASGLAPLDASSKISSTYLPAIAITSVYVVASQAAQLALTAQEGDVAVRSDLNQTYVQNGGSAGTMADWTLLATPTDAVTSVSGRTGVVVLAKADVGLSNVDNTADSAKPVSTAGIAALALKADLASPALTGTPTAPTAAAATNTTQVATTAFVVATAPDVQTFAANGTWTKPAGAKAVRGWMCAGGAGGGGGRRGAAGTARVGGGGGGPGAYYEFEVPAALLPATVAVVVGAGGTAGAAATADDTNGGNGGAGGLTTFDNWRVFGGGAPTGGGNGTGGAGGFGQSNQNAISGGNASATGGVGGSTGGNTYGPLGGAAGGGITAANAASNGGSYNTYPVGLNINGSAVTGSGDAGIAGGAAPGAGFGVSAGYPISGGGGGGGAGSTTGAGQTGGAGGRCGGGGGGGGASVNGSNSGAGGVGGAGFVQIVTYF